MRGAKSRGAVDPGSDGKCPVGHYLIKGVTMENNPISTISPDGRAIKFCDYHWYRQNADGTWSDKPGDNPVNPRIEDPMVDAKNKKPHPYKTDCGNLCVPGKGINTD